MVHLDLRCSECGGHGQVWTDSGERQVACPLCSGTGVGERATSPDWFVLVDTGTPIEPAATLVGPFFTRQAAMDFLTSLGSDTIADVLDALDPDRVRVTKGGRS